MLTRRDLMSFTSLCALVSTLLTMIWFQHATGADNNMEGDKRTFIEQLIRQMTLEEKAGQLTQLSMQLTATGPMIDTRDQPPP